MRKLISSLAVVSVLAVSASATTTVGDQKLGTTATFVVGEIAGNSSQIGVNLKHSGLLKGNENGCWIGALEFTATQDYHSISAPLSFNFYKNSEEFLDIAGVNVYPFINTIKNVDTKNKQNFGGIGLSTNLVLNFKNEKIADIEVGGEKSLFDKSTHKYANLFIKFNIPVDKDLSAYFQFGKVFLTDKKTTTKTVTDTTSVGDQTTTVTTTEPTSTSENTFLLGISYSF